MGDGKAADLDLSHCFYSAIRYLQQKYGAR
jgi:hypothetical protein